MKKYLEIETKYNANYVDLKAFQAFCEARKPHRYVVASGYDHFFHKVTDPNSFCRHRAGPDKNELTFKRKTVDANNYVRTEYNINMGKDSTTEQITAFCAEFGYQYNTSIFKNCFVYDFGHYTLVFYAVYDTQLGELGRFVEIEMDETEHWDSERQALDELRKVETQLQDTFGAIFEPRKRIKQSLFEMFRAA